MPGKAKEKGAVRVRKRFSSAEGVSLKRRLGRLRENRKPVQLPAVPLLQGRLARLRAETASGLAPEAARHATYNFRLGVINGISFTLVEALIAPTIVLAWFVSRLGAPNVLVGLLPAILAGGWFLPQLLVASRVQGRPYMLPYYKTIGIVRAITMLVLAVVTVLLADEPVLLLPAFFLIYIVYSLCAGVSGIPWLEIVGKVISPRRRGSFFGLRNFWGGVLALLAAGPIAAILSEQLWWLGFPYNFAFLFAATAVTVGVGVWSWSSMREPAAAPGVPPGSVRAIIRRGRAALRTDRDFRAFLIIRVLMALATIADPFYVVYAKDVLGAPASSVGLYLGALSLSALLSNFVWSPLSDRANNRTLLKLTVLAMGSVPLCALVVTSLAGLLDNTFLFSAFAAVFVLSGLALGASRIVNQNMLLTIAPPDERATYIGFLNTVLGLVIFVPVFGGLLVDSFGFEPIFIASLGLTLVALIATFQMSRARPALS